MISREECVIFASLAQNQKKCPKAAKLQSIVAKITKKIAFLSMPLSINPTRRVLRNLLIVYLSLILRGIFYIGLADGPMKKREI
jgi:hypothetical protein